jgi:hypothetical protein
MAGDRFHVLQTARNRLSVAPHPALEHCKAHEPESSTPAEHLDRAVQTAVERVIFGGNELARRRFLQLVGASTATAILRSVFPLDTAQALAQDTVKDIEKKNLTVAFIPITLPAPRPSLWQSPWDFMHGIA